MKTVLLTSSILIVLTAALRPLLRGRVDPRVQYALWLAVVLRLLVPVNFADSAYSALALLSRAEKPVQFVESIGQTAIPAQSYSSARKQILEEYRQQGVEEADLAPDDLMAIDDQARELMKGPTLSELFERYARPVWLAGAAGTALWFLLVNLRLRRLLRDARPVEADCPLSVYASGKLPSPCLCGTVRPAVYVTPAALESPDRLRHVLAHELTHYRHKDHWWALVRCLCLCLYWFDPLVWWAAAMSRQDCELACDAGAIRRLGEEERLSYGRTLVAMIASGRNPLLQTATTMTGGRRRVRERIRLIARRPKTVVAMAVAAALFVGCAVGCTFIGAPESTATLDNLQERLLDVPEELKADVLVIPADQGDTHLLVRYWLNRDWTDFDEDKMIDASGGYLLSVRQESYAEVLEHQKLLTNPSWGVIARIGDIYFTFTQPASVWLSSDDAEDYSNAYSGIWAYVREQILGTEDVEPFDLEKTADPLRTVQAVMDEIANAPGASFILYIPEDGLNARQYDTEMFPDGYWSKNVRRFAAGYEWEELTREQAAELMGQGSGVSLLVAPGGGVVSSACITVYEGSQLVAVRTVDNEMKWYKIRRADPSHSYAGDRFLYGSLRGWFDEVELDALRPTTVPDRGQSHEGIAREWAENWEGALTKTAPGSNYACTYVRERNVQADCHSDMDEEWLDAFAQSRNLAAADYGKTWFTFAYQTVFVPVDQSTASVFWAGNTWYYEGGDAPEGALIYERVGYMFLTSEGWTCEGVGTGW